MLFRCHSMIMKIENFVRLLRSLAILSLSTTAVSGEWISGAGKEYYVGTTWDESQSTWFSARAWCMSQGGDLASISSDNDRQIVQAMIRNETGGGTTSYDGPVWIGLSSFNSQNWSWSDGQTFSVTYWAPGNPVSDQPMPLLCAQTSSETEKEGCHRGYDSVTSLWYNAHCDSPATFICRRNPGSNAPITDPPTTPVNGFCPPDYFRAGNKCFKLFRSENTTWDEAYQRCASEPGYFPSLASINDVTENNAILAELRDQRLGLWLGLRKIGSTWLWSDNSPYGYTNWANYVPNNDAGATCGEMVQWTACFSCWNNINCDQYKRGFICQTYPEPGSTPPMTTPNTECPPGYTFHWFGCYRYDSQMKSWSEAVTACNSVQSTASLVSIHSASENAFIQQYLQSLQSDSSQLVWLGLHFDQQNQYYYWQDGWHVTFTRWGAGQPTNRPGSGDGCVGINSTVGTWFSQLCNRTQPYVCWVPLSDAAARTTPPPIDGQCPANTSTVSWTRYGSQCYAASFTTGTWQLARDACRTAGGKRADIASVHSDVEAHFIGRLVRASNTYSDGYWIGLVKNAQDNSWSWTDGSETEFTNWVHNRPEVDSSINLCTRASLKLYDDQWEDVACTGYLPYACQAPLLIRPTAPADIEGPCPEGDEWVHYGDTCMLFKPDDWLTADEATSECRSFGAELATVRSEQENLFIWSQLYTQSRLPFQRTHWLGLRRLTAEDNFIWPDENPAMYTNWAPGSPSSDFSRECVELDGRDSGAEWTDVGCLQERNGYVCSLLKSHYKGPSSMTPNEGHGDSANSGKIAGVVVAVILIAGLLSAGIAYYLMKVRPVRSRAAAAGINNVSYSVGDDDVVNSSSRSRPSATVNTSNGGNQDTWDRGFGGWDTVDGIDTHYNNSDLTNNDDDLQRRLDRVTVGRLSFQQ